MGALVSVTQNTAKDFKFGTLRVRTATTFTELMAKAVHDKIVHAPIFSPDFMNRYSWMYKGTFTKAIGEGLRYIIPQGIVETTIFTPLKAGSKVELEVPFNIDDVSEVVGTTGRFASSIRIPDIMECHDKFTNIRTLNEFLDAKVGSALLSIELHITAYLEYLMSLCPFSKDKGLNMSSFGAAYLACIDNDQDKIQKTLQALKTAFKKECEDKELNVKNIHIYDCLEWYPELVDGADANNIKRYTSPSSNVTVTELKKIYKNNREINPIATVIGVCNAILDHVQGMTELGFDNDPFFPGNNKTEVAKYAKTADKSGIFCRCKRENLIIVMNKRLKHLIMSFSSLNDINPSGTFVNLIQKISQLNIVGSDLIPYGCVKMFDKDRYSIYNLYNVSGNDIMHQKLINIYTAHKGIMIAVREKGVAMRVLHFTNIYMTPLTADYVLDQPQSESLKS